MAARLQTLNSTTLHRPTAPAGGWRRVAVDWLTVSGATAICHALGMVTSLLLKVLLDPAQMGVWQALKMLLGYGNYANLGISKGAIRDYTVALGRGDTRGAERGLDLAFTINSISSVVYATILLGTAAWIGMSSDGFVHGPWAIGLAIIGGLAVLSRYVTFHVTILRAHKAFELTSRLSVLEAVLTLFVCGLATWAWGVYGLFFGTLVVLLGGFLYVQRHRVVDLRWAFDAAEVGRLISVGGPILLAGTMVTLFRSLDKLMILGYMGDREFQLGCYSVAIMVSTQVYGLGNMLSIVMNPRYGEKFGQTGNRAEVARLAAASCELHAAAMALPAALAVVLAVPLLAGLLPDYQTGLPALVWLVPRFRGTRALATRGTIPCCRWSPESRPAGDPSGHCPGRLGKSPCVAWRFWFDGCRRRYSICLCSLPGTGCRHFLLARTLPSGTSSVPVPHDAGPFAHIGRRFVA